jgi:outer membrane receptor protein involved in Fe transport
MKKYVLFLLFLASCLKTEAQTVSMPDHKTTENSDFSTDTLNKEKKLTELVITAQRTATDRFSTAEAINVLSAKQMLLQQARTTPEALMNLNGVFVQKTNHGGGSPFLRGLTGNQTLQLIDGVRLNNATFRYGPNQYLNTIDPLSIERVEVLRGGGSVQYGSDALGGTLQVFTKNPNFSTKPTWNAQVLGRIVTQGMEQTGRSELGFANSKIAFLGGLTYRNFGDLVGGDTTGKQSPSGYDELNFDIKARFRFSPKAILTVAHQNTKQSNVPLYHRIQLENFNVSEFDPQRRQLSYARLDFETENPVFKKIYAIVSLQNTEEGRNSRRNGSTILRIENDKVRSLGLSFNVLSKFRGNTAQKTSLGEEEGGGYFANSGFEIYDDFVKSSRLDMDEKTAIATAKRGLYPNDAKMTSYALFSMHNYTFKKWQFTAGGRLNGFNIQVSDETIGKSTLKPTAFVWNAAILRGVTAHFNLFFSAHSAFRAPNIDDLGTLGIVDFRYETPNFSLNPEKSYNYQLGFKVKTTKLQGETYLYHNQLRNIIARVRVDTQRVQGYPLYRKENVEKGAIQGIETHWNYRFTAGVNVTAGLTYTYGQNQTKNEPMRRIPPINGRLAVSYSRKGVFLSAEYLGASAQTRLAQGDKDDNRIPKGGTPTWSVFNIYGGYVFKNLSLNLSFQNLLNEDYRTHGSGINGVGRSAVLGINWLFSVLTSPKAKTQ